MSLKLGLSPWGDVSDWGWFKYEVRTEADQLTYSRSYGRDDPVVRVQFQTGDSYYSLLPRNQTALGLNFPSKYRRLYSEVTMHFDAEYPHANFLHVSNTWRYDSTSPYVVMISSLIKHRNKSALSTKKKRNFRKLEKTTRWAGRLWLPHRMLWLCYKWGEAWKK